MFHLSVCVCVCVCVCVSVFVGECACSSMCKNAFHEDCLEKECCLKPESCSPGLLSINVLHRLSLKSKNYQLNLIKNDLFRYEV